jgi:hypothetical protein
MFERYGLYIIGYIFAFILGTIIISVKILERQQKKEQNKK